jgi:diguanylate cyclase (GGDEF)-like protein
MVSTPQAPQNYRRSLGARLVLATLGFCFVFTLLTVGVRTWSAWQEALKDMDAELTLVEQVYRQTLSKAIWEMDRDSLHAHVESAAQVMAVGRITLTLNLINRAPEIIEHTADGWRSSSLAPARHLTLSYAPYPGGVETVGELLLAGDERVLWARLRDEASAILVTQLLQSLLLAGLIMLLFDRSVTVHVQHIARHLSQITPETLRTTLRLDRSQRAGDELTLLETGVNQLQAKLSDHLAQLRRYETELADHRDRLAELVQARTAELESLTEVQQLVLRLSNQLIHAPYDRFDDTQRDCLREVAQWLGASRALWLMPDNHDASCRVFLEWRGSTLVDNAQPPRGMPLPAALEHQPLLLFSSQVELRTVLSEADASAFAALDLGPCALARLKSDSDDFGFLLFGKPPTTAGWTDEDRALLAMTAQILLQSARNKAQLLDIVDAREALQGANNRLEDLARHDPLTGLYNRRHFDEMQAVESRRAQRSGQPLSLLICDIDFFKDYNDHYGHPGGDQCLRAVADAMDKSITRSGDTLARIGGEEFAVLLPATSLAAALKVAERLRQSVEALQMPHAASGVTPHVTISIGAAQLDPQHPGGFDTLFEQADQALYRAKETGRNRIEPRSGAELVHPA